ncbi:hypothetical protein [Ascidiimonas aurantiaca]
MSTKKSLENFKVEELEQRLEMGSWEASGSGSVSNDGWEVEGRLVYRF